MFKLSKIVLRNTLSEEERNSCCLDVGENMVSKLRVLCWPGRPPAPPDLAAVAEVGAAREWSAADRSDCCSGRFVVHM